MPIHTYLIAVYYDDVQAIHVNIFVTTIYIYYSISGATPNTVKKNFLGVPGTDN